MDGAPMDLPSHDYAVASTCNTSALTSELADPNFTDPRQTTWVQAQ